MVGWKCSCFVIATEGEPAVFRRKGENFLVTVSFILREGDCTTCKTTVASLPMWFDNLAGLLVDQVNPFECMRYLWTQICAE